jgi:hypothetical protein
VRKATLAGGAFATVRLLAVAAGYRAISPNSHPVPAASPAIAPSTTPSAAGTHQGFLYGRITTVDGATYEGRLRFGGVEEAFWGDTFNGFKRENPWLAQVPPERLTKQHRSIELFGIKIADRESPIDVRRQLMARFGELARIEALGAAPDRMHGTVRTRQRDFTGFLAWNRDEGVGTDELDGRTADGELSLRFDTIRSIARRSRDSSLVTLLDDRELVFTGNGDVGRGNRGIYVDDPRYGRVLISWEAFERVDFSPGGSGPAYGDFPPGRPITGSVTTRAGRRLAGRSTTSTRAKPPRRSTPHPWARTTPFPSACSPRSCLPAPKSTAPNTPG